MVSRDFACQLEGYGPTTASMLYRMPDHRSLLQEFIWQEYDLAPRFPELDKLLAFWSANLGDNAEAAVGCLREVQQQPFPRVVNVGKRALAVEPIVLGAMR